MALGLSLQTVAGPSAQSYYPCLSNHIPLSPGAKLGQSKSQQGVPMTAATAASTTSKGLDGVVAAETKMSFIDGTNGILEYVGIPIAALAEKSTFEETVFLLWNGRLPNRSELGVFVSQIRAQYALPRELIDIITSFPKSAEPMHVLRTGVSALSLWDTSPDAITPDDVHTKGISMMAKMPGILTTFDRYRHGKPPVAPDVSLSFAANLMYMLNGEKPTTTMEKALDACLILHTDHGLNASTFTARVIASTLSDIYSAITGAIGALRGPLHGGANEGVMHMLNEIGSLENVEPYIQKKLEAKDKVMGFGHRVYKTRDPRAMFLKGFSKKLAEQTGNSNLYEMSRKIEDLMDKEVGSRGIYPNVDFYSATTYHCIGLKLDLFTPMFAISRIGGWLGHVIEQQHGNRLIRPKADYIGPHEQPYVPIDKRQV